MALSEKDMVANYGLRCQAEIGHLFGARQEVLEQCALKSPSELARPIPRRPAPPPPGHVDVSLSLEARGAALNRFNHVTACLTAIRGREHALTALLETSQPGECDAVEDRVELVADYQARSFALPILGVGYKHPGRGPALPLLTERFCKARTDPLASMSCALVGGRPGEDHVGDRRKRIEILEQGMIKHEEERMARLGRGTAPLRCGEAGILLEAPALELPAETKLSRKTRWSLVRNAEATRVGGKKPNLGAMEELVKREESLRTEFLGESGEPLRFAGTTAAAIREASLLANTAAAASMEPVFNLLRLGSGSPAVLLQEAERLSTQDGVTGKLWDVVATQLSAKAYEVEPSEVLSMVRVIARAKADSALKLSFGVREALSRSADQILLSLTSSLPFCEIELLIQVVETMAEARCGCQSFLDLLLALLSRHQLQDRSALSPNLATRLASALDEVERFTGLNTTAIASR